MKKIISIIFLMLMLAPTAHCGTGYDVYYPIYRAYNPVSGEHYYTGSSGECFTLRDDYGWVIEGDAWYAPQDGAPLYVLFNPSNGDHLYTIDLNEVNNLERIGWLDNGSFTCGGTQPVYRLYSPVSTRHLYTVDENEYNTLPQFGWNQEGIAFYSIPESVMANRF